MSRTVYKYKVPVDDKVHDFWLPVESQIHLVDIQEDVGYVCFWAEVDTTKKQEHRRFVVTGTGHNVESHWVHVGSVNRTHTTPWPASIVWHLWEVTDE